MKKVALLLLLVLLFITPAHAQTPTSSEKPTQSTIPSDNAELEKIQKIKDIVASKVAELDLVEKRGIIGKIKDQKNTSIIIEDIKGITRNIDVDELTKFSIGKDDDLGLSDLEKDTAYSFIGIYNKDTERLLAREIIEVKSLPIFFEGIATDINEDDYQLDVINAKGEKKTIDVQSSTKTFLATFEEGLEKSGFSKIISGERILVAGFADVKDNSLIAATRVIHFAEIPPSENMEKFVEEQSATETLEVDN